MAQVDVLVVGAGPVGLTAAVELARRGVECRVIDRLAEPLPFAKAVGIQPRTLEVWDTMGVVREALDAAEPLLGQRTYVDGRKVSELALDLPPDVPYGFAALPQYDVERILAERLAGLGGRVERGARLVSFEQDEAGVQATVAHGVGDEANERISARYLIGCDGAHSTVRKGLGLRFEGDAFPEAYMLGDVEVDWSMPHGYAIRSLQRTEGRPDDVLVCIPLPGHGRYRMSMRLPDRLAVPDPAGDASAAEAAESGTASDDGIRHGLDAAHAPELADIQAVLDRLSPEPVTAAHLRWSSAFRISHRLVDHYADGRVFLAGDAAHIHPPTGAQGMNTGIQDAYNLAWKLALAAAGDAAEGLLDSYEAERHPVAEEVVGRTVRHARSGFEADPDDPSTIIRREAQLLVAYPDSPIVGPADPAIDGRTQAAPGSRAPDCRELHSTIATYPLRLFDLLRGTGHTLLLYTDDAATAEHLFPRLAALAEQHTDEHLGVYAVLAPGTAPDVESVGDVGGDTGSGDAAGEEVRAPIVHDTAGQFRAAYAPRSSEAFLIRPDGYLGTRTALTGAGNRDKDEDGMDGVDGALLGYLDRIFAAA